MMEAGAREAAHIHTLERARRLPTCAHAHTHSWALLDPSSASVSRAQGGRITPRRGEALAPPLCHTSPPHGDVLSSRNPARRHPGRHPSQQNPQPRKQPQASKIWVRRTKFWATSWRPLAPIVLAERWHEQPQGSGDEAWAEPPSLAGSRKGAGRRLLPASSEIDCRPPLPTLSH